MSLLITVYTNEGIVMASDSRITYTDTEKGSDGTAVKRVGIQSTDSAYKTFLCNSRVGLSVCGDYTIHNMLIAGYIEEFIAAKVSESSTVEDIAQSVLNYFSAFSPASDTSFIIAGYNPNSSERHVIRVYIGSKKMVVENARFPGAVWNGDIETLQRVINDVGLKRTDGTYADIPSHCIDFHFFTLQDAIDFARYAVDITIKTMRFQNCVKSVGGPIDILAIKPTGAFWVQRKELHA